MKKNKTVIEPENFMKTLASPNSKFLLTTGDKVHLTHLSAAHFSDTKKKRRQEFEYMKCE